jgi:stage II sporulation protein AA (anti-sigma F factor antagonist)
VERSSNAGARGADPDASARDEPRVAHELHGDAAVVTVDGELTEAARRPLVRVLTDLLLQVSTLQRVDLHLAGVTFMNSAGTALLVQLQKMVKPRGVRLVLVAPPPGVVRPLQLTGLWHRFQVRDGGA